jgi:hypothetical protein
VAIGLESCLYLDWIPRQGSQTGAVKADYCSSTTQRSNLAYSVNINHTFFCSDMRRIVLFVSAIEISQPILL